jgi:hypothetical protein
MTEHKQKVNSINLNGKPANETMAPLIVTSANQTPSNTPTSDKDDGLTPFLAEVTGEAPTVLVNGKQYPIKAHVPALIMLQARHEARKGSDLTVGTNSLDLLERFARAIFGADVLDDILLDGADIEQLGDGVTAAMKFYFPTVQGNGKTPPLTSTSSTTGQ